MRSARRWPPIRRCSTRTERADTAARTSMRFSRRRVFAAVAALTAAGVAGLFARSASARYYDGPKSDHFDGTRFFDENGAPPRSLAELARWRLSGTNSNWPAWSPSPYAD